jgi:hypothetical protein
MQNQSNTKTSTPAPANSATQRSRILGLLIAARGEWVPLLEIAACACQYGARVHELRRLGFRIENRTKEIEGSRRSWFRLISGPAETSSSKTTPAASVDAANSHPVSLDNSTSLASRAQETLAFAPPEGTP